jgi:hypothetical protein
MCGCGCSSRRERDGIYSRDTEYFTDNYRERRKLFNKLWAEFSTQSFYVTLTPVEQADSYVRMVETLVTGLKSLDRGTMPTIP